MSATADTEWFSGCGLTHPTGGYDAIEIDDLGRTNYLYRGKPHRLDGPAIVDDQDDFIVAEEWRVAGIRHRIDGPAFRIYFPDGSVQREDFYIEGRRHRLDGPARLTYYPNGEPNLVSYFVEGKRHRLDGPAFARYTETGLRIGESFSAYGEEYEQESFDRLVEALGSGAPLEWAKAYATGTSES